MSHFYPGTAIEVGKIEKGSSKQLFDSIFMTGGITLSQVCIMTGLEPYLIQNWVKRGFVSSPKKRLYSQSQFARIIIINMLREALQIEQICELISITALNISDDTDDVIKDDDLYHRYVDMIAEENINVYDEDTVREAADKAAQGFDDGLPISKRQISRILQVMTCAYFATELRRKTCAKFNELT